MGWAFSGLLGDPCCSVWRMGLRSKSSWSHVVDFFCSCSSYLHCKWATLEELEKDPRISQKIKRFRNKQAQMKHIFTEVRVEHSEQWCLALSPVPWLSRPRSCP